MNDDHELEILYGRDGLGPILPQQLDVTLIEKQPMPVLNDPVAAVHGCLDVGMDACFKASIRGAATACILICDVTRPVPNGLFLRPLIERLLAGGIEKKGITVLVATGLHRPNEDLELVEVVGDRWVIDNVAVVNHFARDAAMHADLGQTPRGTAVKIDRRFVEADVRIATGLVEPHFMAGYSGGRKLIAPGVAGAETITTFHNHAFMSHPNATNCVLDGNPLHEEQLEIVRMVGGAFALNTVIDDQRRLAFVNFGEIVASHLTAVAFMRRYAEVVVQRQWQTVVTTGAGYPLDKTYYQTVKGMVGAMGILADGGDLIIAAECSEGIGSVEYIDAQRRYLAAGRTGFLAAIAKQSHAAIDEWQTQKQAEPQGRVAVSLYSDLDPAARALTGVTCVPSVEAAVADSVTRHGDSGVAVIPEGPYVVPVVATL